MISTRFEGLVLSLLFPDDEPADRVEPTPREAEIPEPGPACRLIPAPRGKSGSMGRRSLCPG